MEYRITHLPERNKFVTEVDGETAWVEYTIYEYYLNIIHTYVPREIGGRGVAADLVKATYTYALANGMKPQATCFYAVLWLRRNPEFLD